MTVTKPELTQVQARRAALLDAIRGGVSRFGELRARLYPGDHRKMLLRNSAAKAGPSALEGDLQVLKRLGHITYDAVSKRWSAVEKSE